MGDQVCNLLSRFRKNALTTYKIYDKEPTRRGGIPAPFLHSPLTLLKEFNMTEPTFPEGSLISYPREDGAVQHAAWNKYLDTHRHPTWANRWFFLQDVLTQFVGKLTKEQLLNLYYNFANTRFMIGMMTTGSQVGLSTVGWNWLPYDVSKGSRKRTAISDALSFTSDYPIPSGAHAGELSLGTWAKDIEALIPEWVATGFWANFNPPVIRSAVYDAYVKLADLKPETPDNALPGKPVTPGNALPGKPSTPDNTLPVDPAAPDNSLPDVGPGDECPDQELPKPPGKPDNTLPPGPDQGLPKPPTGPVAKPTT
jgi:hypothetical protein